MSDLIVDLIAIIVIIAASSTISITLYKWWHSIPEPTPDEDEPWFES